MYSIKYWKNKNELKKETTYYYWNNKNIEKKKEWNIEDHNFLKMESYIQETGLGEDLHILLDIALKQKRTKKKKAAHPIIGIDLAAGNCWTAPYIFQHNVNKMYFLEFSENRICNLAPILLSHYQIPEDKTKLIVGSFYEIKAPMKSFDFIIMSQAFHHADNPNRVLREVHRVLKDDGYLLILGEPVVKLKDELKYYLRILSELLSCNKTRYLDEFIKTRCIYFDEILGDHIYTRSRYHSYFLRNGFCYRRIAGSKKTMQSFLLTKYSRKNK